MSIEVPEMIIVLTSIYETLKNEEGIDMNIVLQVDLCLNWLLNLFDNLRTGQLRVQQFKLGILILCGGPQTGKYIHMFNLLGTSGGGDDPSANRLTPSHLGLLLLDCMNLPRVFGEIASFGGSNIEPSVRGCFAMISKKEGTDKISDQQQITCKDFLKWLKQEPQCLVWLPVLHRLVAAESAKHNIKCKTCSVYPIIGFRYHCLKCFNFDMCQNCFFTGKLDSKKKSKGHKAEHPMQEYCTSTGTSDNIKIFGKAVKNSFRRKKYFKKKQQKLSYLPIQSVTEGDLSALTGNSLSPNLSIGSGMVDRDATSEDGYRYVLPLIKYFHLEYYNFWFNLR